MRKLLAGIVMSLVAGSALAADFDGGDLQIVTSFPSGQPGTYTAPRGFEATGYSNVTNFTGSAFANGGAEVQGANTITRMVCDDTTFDGTGAGQFITQLKFSIFNGNSGNVLARPRIRFWFADGAGGNPGTYYNVPGNVGFSFNPLTVGPGVTVVTATIGTGLFTMPGAGVTMWSGVTYDNNNGTAAGVTAAVLNNMGQGTFDPPTIGTSADNAWQSTLGGSFFTTANPAGAAFNFGGAPVANFGWEFSAPEPASLTLLALGIVAFARRR